MQDPRAFTELRTSRSAERYRQLFEANPLPTWVFDRKTLAFLEVNEAAIHHYGYSRCEFLSMTIADIRPPEDVGLLKEHIRCVAGVSESGLWRHLTKDGRIIFVELKGRDFQFDGREARLVAAHDVTARLEAEQTIRRLDVQLQQAQKLEAIGRLAGGMAHDFNNILTAVVAYGEFIAETLEPGDPLREDAVEITKAGRRGADLTRHLLAFSSKQVIEPVVMNLDDLVADIEPMLRRLIREDIVFATISHGAPATVKADHSQMEQVLLNLVVNACDAMPSGGHLTIETGQIRVEGEPFVFLSITDTGEGMSEEVQARIFEPLFTTKDTGQGTGLGLSIVYGIVQQGGGKIGVESEPGNGTSFEILLPRVSGIPAQASDRGRVLDPVGPAVILVVDDDRAVRRAIRRTLARSHYVLEAATASEARELCAHYQGKIDLLLTDLIMPYTSGAELAAEIGERWSEMRVLFMSGYTDSVEVRGGLDPSKNFIAKPFLSNDLLQKVTHVLTT